MKIRMLLMAIVVVILMNPLTSFAEWKYQKEHDKMRGTTTEYAICYSKPVNIGFPYGVQSLRIIYKKGDPENIMLNIRGQFSSPIWMVVPIKFDDRKIEKVICEELGYEHPGWVIVQDSSWHQDLKSCKKLIMEVPIFQKGAVQFEFDISGLRSDW